MKTSKFFRFTISGNELNLSLTEKEINLPAELFHKDIPVRKIIANKERWIPQKTNRWVYSNESFDYAKPESFLTKNLTILKNNITTLKEFIDNYDCRMDLIIYSGNKTDLCLTPKLLKMLDGLGVKLYISFC